MVHKQRTERSEEGHKADKNASLEKDRGKSFILFQEKNSRSLGRIQELPGDLPQNYPNGMGRVRQRLSSERSIADCSLKR